MDFLDFDNHELYFDGDLSSADEALLKKAADAYPSKESENILLELHDRLPNSLTVIVALYRFYYYQHRYHDALAIAGIAMDVSANMMGVSVAWHQITEMHLGKGVLVSMGLTRFYILALKASAYVLMRIGEVEQAHARLQKIIELDPVDQFGASFLYRMAEKELGIQRAAKHNVASLFQH
jgi:tetratricopeptide (TPR) repeat protein